MCVRVPTCRGQILSHPDGLNFGLGVERNEMVDERFKEFSDSLNREMDGQVGWQRRVEVTGGRVARSSTTPSTGTTTNVARSPTTGSAWGPQRPRLSRMDQYSLDDALPSDAKVEDCWCDVIGV